MGVALWLVAGGAAFFVARIVPAGRPARLAGEALTAMVAAMLAGVAATALDFGGWNELDWRAAAFTFCVAAAAIAAVRVIRVAR